MSVKYRWEEVWRFMGELVEVLLATYNGEKYISAQLDSLLTQSYANYRILVRDDGSKDNTVNIIRDYQSRFPEQVRLIEDEKKCGSSVSNFMQLTQYATADYVMYCDQDDFWLKNKISVTMKKMLEIERKVGKETPVCVYTSYKVVDGELKPIPVNIKKNQIYRNNLEFNRLLVQNYVTGCLMMVNKSLYSMSGEYDERILMHDWWLSLIASSFGKIVHLDTETMLYRQHNNNVVGAVNVLSMQYRMKKILDKNTAKMKYYYMKQALLFKKRYYTLLDSKSQKTLDAFLDIYKTKSKIGRIRKLIKGRFFKSDIIRSLGQIVYI